MDCEPGVLAADCILCSTGNVWPRKDQKIALPRHMHLRFCYPVDMILTSRSLSSSAWSFPAILQPNGNQSDRSAEKVENDTQRGRIADTEIANGL